MPQPPQREALELALLLHAEPLRARAARSLPLPAGVADVLRAALGNTETLEAASAELAVGASELSLAARFFIEQLMLARECERDPWRVLGLRPDAAPEQLREHRRLLLSLVHPDRGGDWPAAFYDRVQQAWLTLRSGDASAAVEPDSGAEWGAPSASGDIARVALAGMAQPGAGLRSPTTQAPVRLRGWFSAALLVLVGLAFMPDRHSHELVLFPTGEGAGPDSTDVRIVAGAEVAGGASASAAVQPHSSSLPAETDRSASLLSSAPLSAPVLAESTDAGHPADLAAGQASIERRVDRFALAGREVTEPASTPAVSTATVPRAVAATDQAESRIFVSADLAAVGEGAALQASSGQELADRTRLQPPAEPLPSAPDVQVATTGSAMSAKAPAAVPAARPQPDRASQAPFIPSAEPVKSIAVVPVQPAPVTTGQIAVAPPSDAQAVVVLEAFRTRYEAGDLAGLLKLFSMRDRSDGGAALALDYGRLFGSTRERKLALSDLRWQVNGDRLAGAGRFRATYLQQGRFGRVAVEGAMHFEVVIEDATPRLLRLDSRPGRG